MKSGLPKRNGHFVTPCEEMVPAKADAPNVVVIVAQLPGGATVQIELTVRLSDVPAPVPKAFPVVVA